MNNKKTLLENVNSGWYVKIGQIRGLKGMVNAYLFTKKILFTKRCLPWSKTSLKSLNSHDSYIPKF